MQRLAKNTLASILFLIFICSLFPLAAYAEDVAPAQTMDAEAQALLQQDYDALLLYDTEDVRGHLPLADTGKNGSAISWQSSNPAVVTDTVTDGRDAGIVTRPAAGTNPAHVTLTATLAMDGAESLTKTFDVTVQSLPENLDTDYTAGYLWTYFNGSSRAPTNSPGTTNNRYKIMYGASEDGLHWKSLNLENGSPTPVAESTVGFTGVRDPHIIRSYEGDKYWILGTDLQDGFDQYNGSQSIIVWESDDLVSWSESRLELVFDNAGCAWAPEAIYDKETGYYLVYWASRDRRDYGTNQWALRMYVSRTRDFHTFSEPVVWADVDDDDTEKNIIDSSILYSNGYYYRFSTSDWHTIVDYCDRLSMDMNDWTTIVARGEYGSYGFDSMEGITSYQLPDGRWCVMGDNSAYRGFVIEEEDLHSMQFTKLGAGATSSTTNSFDRTFRHGTVLRLSAAEEERVMNAYGGGYNPTPKYVTGVKRGSSDPFMAEAGESVTVKATDKRGYTFSGWSFHGVELEEEQPSANPATFTMPANNAYFTAEYVEGDENSRPVSDANGLFYKEDFEDFDANQYMALHGTAAVTEEDGNHVLRLDGVKNNAAYSSLPEGWLDGLDSFTIAMDLQTQTASGNFFTLSIGQNDQKYMFLRARQNDFALRVTQNSWGSESAADATLGSSALNQWKNVTITMDGNRIYLYIDGLLAAKNEATNANMTDLGEYIKVWFGRSFYSADNYFKGAFDNIELYDRALTALEIAGKNGQSAVSPTGVIIGTVTAQPSTGLDEHTAVFASLDKETKTISSYIKKYTYDIESNTSTPTNLAAVPVTFALAGDEIAITLDDQPFANGSTVDLTSPKAFTFTYGQSSESWTVETPLLATNSVLPGKFADPDIDKFEGKYWLFPTTDGYNGWSGQVFHAFSADSLSGPWTDEGEILHVNRSTEPYTNIKGRQVAVSPWSVGSAWAPCIEEKDGKYYFYYCAKYPSGTSAIGVAVADSPAGPYTAMDTPLIDFDVIAAARALTGRTINVGQNIDPDVLTTSDGRHYLYWGNGNTAAVVELNDDLTSVKLETMQNLVQTNGGTLTGFRESVTVLERDGLFHFLWSQDDTGSPNYKVQYGTSASPLGPVQYRYVLNERYDNHGILGSAHQATFTDDDGSVYLAYHRFYTPLGQVTDGLGYNRETCINQIPFDEETGLMLAIQPTMEGVDGPIVLQDGSIYTPPAKPVDKAALNAAIAEAQALEQGKYTAESWAALATALAQAAATSQDGDATQNEVDAAAQALQNAMEALVEKGDGEDVPVTGIRIESTGIITLRRGKNLQLTAAIAPANATDPTVIWSCPANGVVSVDSSGKVSGLKAGIVTVTATSSNGLSHSVIVRVTA